MALLSELIGQVLEELDLTRERYENKRNYLVEDITLEINVKKITSGKAGVKIVIANVGGELTDENSHKIIVKLKPKKTLPVRNNQ
jgi:hypothetical protein